MHRRVLPRDLFNEAKLLKCLGRLILLHHEGKLPDLKFKLRHETAGFKILQDDSSGDLECVNLHFRLVGRQVNFRSSYNSKEAYPLLCVAPDYTEVSVFNEDGTLHMEFMDYIVTLRQTDLKKST